MVAVLLLMERQDRMQHRQCVLHLIKANSFERVDQSLLSTNQKTAMSCFCAQYFLLCTDGSWIFLAGRYLTGL